MRIILFLILGFAFSAKAAVVSHNLTYIEAPDGIQIGPSSVLPIKEYDEFVFERGSLELTAGEVRTLNFGSNVTFHGGAHCWAEVLNPQTYNNDQFLILHTWFDGEVKVQVRNLSASSVQFDNDQIVVTCANTSNFRK